MIIYWKKLKIKYINMNLILLINIKNKHIMVFGFLSNFILL